MLTSARKREGDVGDYIDSDYLVELINDSFDALQDMFGDGQQDRGG